MSEAGRRGEGFLGRWSRLKSDRREADSQAPVEVDTPAQPVASDGAPPELPPVDTLTIESDFTGFLHPKVDEDLRRTALRKLFSEPHFNVMDGLDVYIDDYSVSEPLPASMLADLKQAQRILRWAEGKDDETADEAEPPAEAAEAVGDEQAAVPAAIEAAVLDDVQSDVQQSAVSPPLTAGKPD
jgi:hypothetical protein